MRLSQLLDRAALLASIALAVVAWSHFDAKKTERTTPLDSNLSVIVQDHLKKSHESLAAVSVSSTAEKDLLTVPSEEELQQFPGASVVESAEVEGPGPNQVTRIKILQTDFKSLVRSEEVVDKDTGDVMDHEEMAADHLLVNLPAGENPETFLSNLGPEVASMSPVAADAPMYTLNLANPSIASLPLVLAGMPNSVICGPDIIHHSIDAINPDFSTATWGLLKVAGELNQFTAASKSCMFSSKLVAVIDSGIRYTHQELKQNMWRNPSPTAKDYYGWNAYGNNGDPLDDNGHGTFCAGVIGAAGKNSLGMIGVSPRVGLMACKAFDKNGNGMVSDEVTCIDYACKHGAKVLNCSWGGPDSSFLYDALRRAQSKGVICVAAAGNDGQENSLTYPAAYGIDTDAGAKLDNIVSVAASTEEDGLASFSNYGSAYVPIAAPGVDIFSAFNTSDSSYAVGSGTSMATPYVAGALILLEAQFPNQSYEKLIQKMFHAADKTAGLTGTVGFGRLNITKALTQ